MMRMRRRVIALLLTAMLLGVAAAEVSFVR